MRQPLLDHASGGHVDTSTNSISWNHILGQGYSRGLFVVVQARVPQGNESMSVVSSITFNGVAMTEVTNPGDYLYQSPSQINHQRQRITIWRLDEQSLPPAGTYPISISFAGTVDFCVGIAVSFFFLKKGNPEAKVGPNTYTSGGGSGTISANITTLTPNALVLEITGCANGSYWTPGTGQSIAAQITANGASIMSYKVVPYPATTLMSETNSNAESLAQMLLSIPFKNQPGAAAVFNML